MPLSCVSPADFNEPDNFFFFFARDVRYLLSDSVLKVSARRLDSVSVGGVERQLSLESRSGLESCFNNFHWQRDATDQAEEYEHEYDQWVTGMPTNPVERDLIHGCSYFATLDHEMQEKLTLPSNEIKHCWVVVICCQRIMLHLPYRCYFQVAILVYSLPVKPTRNEKSFFFSFFVFSFLFTRTSEPLGPETHPPDFHQQLLEFLLLFCDR